MNACHQRKIKIHKKEKEQFYWSTKTFPKISNHRIERTERKKKIIQIAAILVSLICHSNIYCHSFYFDLISFFS